MRPRLRWGLTRAAARPAGSPCRRSPDDAAPPKIRRRYRRYRLDADQHRAGAADDHSRPGAVLRRHGAQEEHPRDHDAVASRSPASSPSSGRSPATASPSPPAPRLHLCRRLLALHAERHLRTTSARATTPGFMLGAGIDGRRRHGTTIPETVYMMFQMTFAIITPALIAGAFADRMKFSALCIFMTLWSLLVYSPIAHWVWAPSGWGAINGQLDFAGGTVVHINAGIAGLVCCAGAGQARRLRHRQHGAVQPGLRGDRRLAAVGRLVRVQRRFRGRLPTAAPAWR